MTAMNIVKRREEIILITDGAAYDEDGTLLHVAPKVDLLPHFSGFVMQSGGSAWSPAIAALFATCIDTDDLFDKAAGLLLYVEEQFAGISSQPIGRVMFGGWSAEQGQMRLGVVFSSEAAALDQDGLGAEVIQPDAYTVQELLGDQLLCQPPINDRAWIEGFGGPIYDLAQISDVEEFASFLLTAQRAVGAPHRGVGGFGQITTITRTESSVRIFERYDDVVGEVMHPIPPDWRAWRARRQLEGVAPVNAPGGSVVKLSRQERRAAEAKARKGTLRAV